MCVKGLSALGHLRQSVFRLLVPLARFILWFCGNVRKGSVFFDSFERGCVPRRLSIFAPVVDSFNFNLIGFHDSFSSSH